MQHRDVIIGHILKDCDILNDEESSEDLDNLDDFKIKD